jgi:hypothetical protein
MILRLLAIFAQVGVLGCQDSCEEQFKSRTGLLTTSAEVTDCTAKANPHNKYDLRMRARVKGLVPSWSAEAESTRCVPNALAREAVAQLAPQLPMTDALDRSLCISNSDGYLVVYRESQFSFLAMYRGWPQIPSKTRHAK